MLVDKQKYLEMVNCLLSDYKSLLTSGTVLYMETLQMRLESPNPRITDAQLQDIYDYYHHHNGSGSLNK